MSMKPGDAMRDRAQEELDKLLHEADVARQRLEFRAEMRSAGEDEDSGVIDQRVLESQRRQRSEPPERVKPLTRVLELLPPAGRVVVVLALIALAAFVVARGGKLW